MKNLIKRTPGQIVRELKQEAYLTLAEVQTGSYEMTKNERRSVIGSMAATAMVCSTSGVYAAGKGDEGEGGYQIFDEAKNILDSAYGKFAALVTVCYALAMIVCFIVGMVMGDEDWRIAKKRMKTATLCFIGALALGWIIDLAQDMTKNGNWDGKSVL